MDFRYSRAHDIALLRVKLDLPNPDWLNNSVLPDSSFGISGNKVHNQVFIQGTTNKTYHFTLYSAITNVMKL